MGAFDAVTLAWAGSEYVIPGNRVLGAIARIEDVVTLEELGRYGERGTMPLAKLAMAYGAVLRYAGANVKDDEVLRRHVQRWTEAKRSRHRLDVATHHDASAGKCHGGRRE